MCEKGQEKTVAILLTELETAKVMYEESQKSVSILTAEIERLKGVCAKKEQELQHQDHEIEDLEVELGKENIAVAKLCFSAAKKTKENKDLRAELEEVKRDRNKLVDEVNVALDMYGFWKNGIKPSSEEIHTMFLKFKSLSNKALSDSIEERKKDMNEKMVIYRDMSDSGDSYTICRNGVSVASSLLADDEKLQAIPNWEKFVVDGLDNRTEEGKAKHKAQGLYEDYDGS